MNRRRFLTAAVGIGASLPLGRSALRAFSTGEPAVAERSSRALGSEVKITAYHANRAVAEQGVAAAFAELETVEEVMSLYRPHSQLCRLNRAGVLRSPHAYLLEVLDAGRQMAERTHGAFDVTVQPLWEVYSQAAKTGREPTADVIAAACGKVDWRRVEAQADEVRLTGQGTAVTLNGIAQGFAADRALAALQQAGVQHALINTGELNSLGESPGRGAWRVGIQHPRQADAFAALVQLDGRSLATSGDYATTFNGEFRTNHVFDPRTGRSPSDFSSVSVVAPSALMADALSTALFVLDLEAGVRMVKSMPGADALYILKNGSMKATTGFPRVA